MFSLLDISIQEMQTMLDEMSKNSEVPSMPYENFSFSSDLKEFLTVGPTVSLQGPLHANTLNQLFQEYQKMNNQQKNSSLDTVQN